MKKTNTKKQLNTTVDYDTIKKILAVGHEFDVNKNGLFDARSGCVNFWCSPEDKPDCWNEKIDQGALEYPRDYVGGLYWDENCSLYIEVSPYELLRYKAMSDEDWKSCTDWVEKQVKNLIRLAGIHETTLGTCCPFCNFILPLDCLLNDLVDHMITHEGIQISGITLGRPTKIETNKGAFELKAKTDVG